jgi:hypothetical protein
MIEVYRHANSIMKPNKNLKGGEERRGLRKGNIYGVNLIRVHCMHECKYNNDTSLCN